MSLPGLDFLFDVSSYPARWHCGRWTDLIGWTYIISDLLIFVAYVGIPASLLYYKNQIKASSLQLNYIFYLFASFIFFCGSTHLIDAIIFWHPIYNFAGLILLSTAIISLATLGVIFIKLPSTLKFISQQMDAKNLKIELERMKAQETKNALIAVEARNAKLTELDQLKSDFLANISHELRTPLTLIMGPLESILKDSDNVPEMYKDNLLRMQRNTHRLYSLVNDVLDFSKLEAGKFKVNKQVLNLHQQIKLIVFDAQGLAQERQLKMTFTGCPELSAMWLDRKMVDRIAMNLISNALKFTPNGGEIQVSLEIAENYAKLIVKDNGIGIPQSQINRLFKRFHQVDSSYTRSYEGTGIGLALVYEFTRLLNGFVEVESEEGKGSTFTVNFPLQVLLDDTETSTLADDADCQNMPIKKFVNLPLRENNLQTAKEKIAKPLIGKKPPILLADDNEDMKKFIVSILDPYYEIIEANDGKEALELAHYYKPHVIITDVMMPIIDGYELTKAIKSDLLLKHTPVIILTAKTAEQSLLWSLDIGADDFLSKPFSPDELLARTASALRNYNAYNEIQSLQSKLQKEREIIQSVMAEGLCVFDSAWKIVCINNTAEKYLDYTESEALGLYYNKLFSIFENDTLDKKSIELSLLTDSLSKGIEYNHDHAILINRSNKSTHIAFSISCLPLNEKGQFNGAVLLFRDINKQLAIENELKDLLKISENSNLAKANFLANMSHEIRTPLNGVMGLLQLVLASDLDEKQYNYVDKSYKAADSLLKIIGDILDYSKIDSGEMSLESIAFEFHKELESCISVQKPICDQKHIEMKLNISNDTPVHVVGDSVRIKQIFNNLISNAIKFTPEGGKIIIQVAVAQAHLGSITLACSVSDNGIGIPLNAQSKIFEKFSQADESTTRKYGGTGLGLAITKRLIELMGGTIEVESREGMGTTFKFTLNVGNLVPGLEIEPPAFIKKRRIQVTTSKFPIDVLIVEDNELNQLVTTNMMKTLGCSKIDVVNSGELALEAIQKRNYQLILMDCHMPGMDGLTTSKLIRELENKNNEEKKIIIALTANALIGMEKSCLEAGIDAYISKPVKFEYLTSVLEKHLPSSIPRQDK